MKSQQATSEPLPHLRRHSLPHLHRHPLPHLHRHHTPSTFKQPSPSPFAVPPSLWVLGFKPRSPTPSSSTPIPLRPPIFKPSPKSEIARRWKLVGQGFKNQKRYTLKLLDKFAMKNCKLVSTPFVVGEKLQKEDGAPKTDGKNYRSLIGSLLYLTATRPDIVFAVNYLSRFMQSPSETHFIAAKRVLRYLKGTSEFGILVMKSTCVKLVGFCDSDWAGSEDNMMSTSGYCFSIGGSIFCWNSKKQSVVAHSTAEAEYIAANQLVWIRKMLTDLEYGQRNPTELFCDNTSAIAISKNSVFHDKTKHMKIKFHAVRQFQQEGELELVYCTTEEQLADLFTKPLAKNRFQRTDFKY